MQISLNLGSHTRIQSTESTGMTVAPKCCRVDIAQLLSRSTVDVPIIILAAQGVRGFISVSFVHSPVFLSAHSIRNLSMLLQVNG